MIFKVGDMVQVKHSFPCFPKGVGDVFKIERIEVWNIDGDTSKTFLFAPGDELPSALMNYVELINLH